MNTKPVCIVPELLNAHTAKRRSHPRQVAPVKFDAAWLMPRDDRNRTERNRLPRLHIGAL
jgi:hypothetical protein